MRTGEAIDGLSQEYQSVLFWAVEDFSYKEIADALDILIGTTGAVSPRAAVAFCRRN
jgi:DNA-directed RNA polymerase specialized sigma24 family protein